ncbi:hypothetical protein PPSIR1_05743 [Plesiocystis pacifica SIR-1]|uniref:Uncharacterized protein n=1 Tax=Plesiocystis pacifica SIR-1 TaxID=391625 RepID=A6FXC1_9BACT|nr:hypothetical protein PPSIR1_05743 [Plesiocystis pacifica SIR-1]
MLTSYLGLRASLGEVETLATSLDDPRLGEALLGVHGWLRARSQLRGCTELSLCDIEAGLEAITEAVSGREQLCERDLSGMPYQLRAVIRALMGLDGSLGSLEVGLGEREADAPLPRKRGRSGSMPWPTPGQSLSETIEQALALAQTDEGTRLEYLGAVLFDDLLARLSRRLSEGSSPGGRARQAANGPALLGRQDFATLGLGLELMLVGARRRNANMHARAGGAMRIERATMQADAEAIEARATRCVRGLRRSLLRGQRPALLRELYEGLAALPVLVCEAGEHLGLVDSLGASVHDHPVAQVQAMLLDAAQDLEAFALASTWLLDRASAGASIDDAVRAVRSLRVSASRASMRERWIFGVLTPPLRRGGGLTSTLRFRHDEDDPQSWYSIQLDIPAALRRRMQAASSMRVAIDLTHRDGYTLRAPSWPEENTWDALLHRWASQWFQLPEPGVAVFDAQPDLDRFLLRPAAKPN